MGYAPDDQHDGHQGRRHRRAVDLSLHFGDMATTRSTPSRAGDFTMTSRNGGGPNFL